MRFFILITSLLVSVLFVCAAGAQDKQGDDKKDEARKHFKVGISLLKAEKFEAAAVEFGASVDLFPTKAGLFNLANCLKTLSRYDEALSAIEHIEKDFKDGLDTEMREAVTGLKDEINALVARVTFQINVEGARIRIDDKPVGKSPRERAFLLEPGRHSFVVGYKDQEPFKEELTLLSGDNHTFDVTFKAGEENGEKDGKKLGPVPVIVAGALTVGLGVGTIILNSKITDKADEAKKNGDTDEMASAEKMQVGGRVMFGLTAAALVATGVLLFFTDFKGGEKETEDDEAVSLNSLGPMVTENGGGFVLGGKF